MQIAHKTEKTTYFGNYMVAIKIFYFILLLQILTLEISPLRFCFLLLLNIYIFIFVWLPRLRLQSKELEVAAFRQPLLYSSIMKRILSKEHQQ